MYKDSGSLISETIGNQHTKEDIKNHKILLVSYGVIYSILLLIDMISVLKMNCLLIRPRWMWEEKDVIGNVPLHSLMIPGTHNSGSFIPRGSSVSNRNYQIFFSVACKIKLFIIFPKNDYYVLSNLTGKFD